MRSIPILVVSGFLMAFPQFVIADCLGPAYVRSNDPCNVRPNRQNSFGDHNTPQPRITNEERADSQRRMAEQDRINRSLRDYADRIDAQHAAEAEARRRQQAREQELALRQQEIAARNAQAEAMRESAEAARRAAIAAENAAQEAQRAAARPPVIVPRGPMHCNFNNGWCD